MPSVSSSYLKNVYDTGVELGADVSAMRGLIEGGEAALNQPTRRFSIMTFLNVMDVAAQTSGAPAFGVQAGMRLRPSTLMDHGYALTFCRSIGDVMHTNARYQALTQQLGHTWLETVDGSGRISWAPNDAVEYGWRHTAELAFAGYATIGRWLLWRHDHPIQAMMFRHKRPCDAAMVIYDKLFGCPITFEAETDAMFIDQALIEQDLPNSNPDLLRHLMTRLDIQLSEVGEDVSTSRNVLHCIQTQMVSQKPTVASVAAALGLGDRTLRRYLAEEGTSFRALLMQARREACEVYLRQGNVSQAQIAQLLGYRDQSAFSRAYRQWHGVPPGRLPH